MSRMLKALQQIEDKAPQPPQRPEPARPQPPKSQPAELQPASPLSAVVPDSQESGPMATVVDTAAVEAALARAEAAAAMAADGPADESAQAYGELADAILSQLPAKRPACLMFTSPGDGEGKTEMLVGLAKALVQRVAGEVLLVDGDLRGPTLAGHLGVEAGRGLADVLAGVAGWQEMVRRTGIPRLNLLPGARLSTRDDWPPARSNVGPLLAELSGKYRLVLVDTASLAYPEVAPMAQYCVGTYLVVRLGRTTHRAVREAVRVLADCGGRVLGSVLIGG